MPRSSATLTPFATRAFRAGPLLLDCSARDGDLRYIRTPAVELVRRVYFVARDRNWLNVAQRLSPPRLRAVRGGFVLTTDGRSQGPDHRLAWQLRISGFANGTVTFSVNGRALADCVTNRVGLCVHLPLEGFAGARYGLVTGAGAREKLTLPVDVAPTQPCTDIRVMRFALPRRHRLELAFDGDEFEIEDQRNWIDGSFKIYSRPLARGYPYTIKAGETFSQSLTIRLLAPGRQPVPRQRPSTPVTIRLGKKLSHQAPALGLGLPRNLAPHSRREAEAIARLGVAHLRADIDEFAHDLATRVRHAATTAAQLGAPLELALTPGEKTAPRDFAKLASALRAAGVTVARVLVFGPSGQCVASRATFGAARRHFGAKCAAGTDFNFAELNRGRPRLPAARAFTFAANPQVHASDELSMAECLEGLRHSLVSARRYFPRADVGVSRLTLRPQKNAVAAGPSKSDDARRFDSRQSSAWCAAWTVGALGPLQTAGASWATLYETAGPGGVVSGPKAFPVHRALADYLACGSATPRELAISEPLRVAGWARGNCLVLANLSAAPVRLVLAGLPARRPRALRLPSYGYAKIIL